MTLVAEDGVRDAVWTPERIEARIVRYRDLRPCFNAFVDTRTPGSEAKENFTIIGPGVSENPQQHVHIAEPHGFNIGGARQPPGCVNSQHSHDTAEVFVVQSGRWRFDLGEHGEDAQLLLGPGDVVSLPTRVFRGFTNVGDDVGYLWAVLGQDDPGRVTWAPQVFEMAAEYGLVLLESGRLVDTASGEIVPAGARPMPPTSREQVAALDRYTPEDAQRLVWRAADGRPGETRLIGAGAVFGWPHGFTLSRLELIPGASEGPAAVTGARVLYVQAGGLTMTWAGGAVALATGDTITIPRGLAHGLTSDAGAVAFIVHGTD